MTTDEPRRQPAADWVLPRGSENDLRRYLTTLRQRAWLIVLAVIVCVLGAIIYVASASPVYEAEAQLLVTPISSTGANRTSGLGLIASSSDPAQDVETAARLVPSVDAAARAKQQLGLKESPQAILRKVSVQPVANSSVLAVTARGSSAAGAAQLANVLAADALAIRQEQFNAAVQTKLTNLSAEIAKTPQPAAQAPLLQQAAALQALRSGGLPDMSLSTRATPPSGRTSPRALLSIIGAAIVGLVLGIVGAFALEAFDTTLRREEQLRRIFQLPVLARISRERDRPWSLRGGRPSQWILDSLLGRETPPRLPQTLAPSSREAFRTLRATLLASRGTSNPIRSTLITSASPSEGKTTTAINLAFSLALSGASTILIEADLRRPILGGTIGLRASHGLADVLTGEVELSEALVSSDRYPDTLSFLLAARDVGPRSTSADALFLPTAHELLDRAEELAEYVVIDAPPLAAVSDALNLAREADAVLVVTMLGRTNVDRLTELGSLLAGAGVTPAGLVVFGVPPPRRLDLYPYGRVRAGEPWQSAEVTGGENGRGQPSPSPRAGTGSPTGS